MFQTKMEISKFEKFINLLQKYQKKSFHIL